MKSKFTFLVVLFLLTTSIYALEPAHNKSSKLTGSFLKNRHERTEGITKHNPFHRKMEFQKQAGHLKSAQAIKQRLDSYTSQERDEITGQWIPEEKAEFTYDDKWNVTLESYYEWEELASQWVLDSKYESTYDANGNMTQQIEYYLNENNLFLADDKDIYSYDANGHPTQEINYSWDSSTNTFVSDRKYDFTYDANENLIQEVRSYVDETTNQLTPKYNDEYIYNVSGKKTRHQQSYWDKPTNQWKLTYKDEFTYDSNGNVTLILQSSWDGLSQWQVSTKDEYSYDANGNLVLYLDLSMNNGEWKPNYKDVNTFDDKGNNTQSIFYYNWDVSTSQWNDVGKSETTFDNSYTFNDLILPFEDDDYFFTHMITEIKEYDWNNDTKEWILDSKTSLTYSAQNVTSIKSMDAEISRIFPNPFSESLSFSIPDFYSQVTFELFDLQGRKLLSKVIGNNEKVNMQGLNSGIYIYKLNIDGKVQIGKLVKE